MSKPDFTNPTPEFHCDDNCRVYATFANGRIETEQSVSAMLLYAILKRLEAMDANA